MSDSIARKVLRVGVVGLGWAGQVHCRALRQLSNVQLVAVADNDPTIRAEQSAALSVPVMDSVGRLLSYDLDYCIVAAPTDTHAAIGTLLAKAGVHALIEKPLAESGGAAFSLLKTFADAGLVGSVGHTERRNPAVREVKRLIDSGSLGNIFHISTRRQGPFPERVKDVGVVQDLIIHDIDLVSYLVGVPVASVSAYGACISGSSNEDIATVNARLENGLLITHHASRVSALKERLLVVHSSAGCVVADTLAFTVSISRNSKFENGQAGFCGVSLGESETRAMKRAEPFFLENKAMRDAVLGLPHDAVTLRDGLYAVEVADAILRSISIGDSVVVSYAEL